MKRTALIVALLGCSVLSMGPECGLAAGDKATGEPCTRSSECVSGLICHMGMCHPPLDASVEDASNAGSSDSGSQRD